MKSVDLICAIEDSDLTPAQRKHWKEMEEKQAAKEQAERMKGDRKRVEMEKAGEIFSRDFYDQNGRKLGG